MIYGLMPHTYIMTILSTFVAATLTYTKTVCCTMFACCTIIGCIKIAVCYPVITTIIAIVFAI